MSDIETRREEAGQSLSYGVMFKGIMIILLPLFLPALFMNIAYYTLRWSIELTLASTVMLGSIGSMVAYMYYHKTGDELHGKQVLILTYREGRGRVWSDFAVIQHAHPITKPSTKAMLTRGIQNPPEIFPYEYVFDNFMPFDRLILLQPCPKEDLLEFTPQPVIYKGLFVNGSAAPLDVTRVKQFKWYNDELVVVAVPTGCDYYAEHIQRDAKAFAVSKEDIDKVVKDFDSFKSIEYRELLISREQDLAATKEVVKDFDKAVDERANAKVKAYLKTRKVERRLPGFLKWKKTWLLIGALVLLTIFVWAVFS